jgi:hypothetical protein
MDAQFLAQLPQVEAMCTALYTAQVGGYAPAVVDTWVWVSRPAVAVSFMALAGSLNSTLSMLYAC